MPRPLAIVTLAAMAMFAPSTAHADGTTHKVRVNGDIQAAIDSASNGDTIQLSAGQYDITTTIDPGGKQVTILGTVDANGKPTSILHGGHVAGGDPGQAILGCDSGETSETVFRNLVIQNGFSPFGGGVGLSNSSPTLINCMLIGNRGLAGGGIYSIQGNPTLIDCTFQHNSSSGGGGILIEGGSPTLTRCLFSANSSELNGDQADYGNGGAVTIIGATPTLTECTFTNNSAARSGGGIYIVDSGSPILKDCRFCGNHDNTGFNSIGGEAIDGSSSGNAMLEEGCVLGDINFDGVANLADRTPFNNLIGVCDADINGDGEVNGADLAFVLGYWGVCTAP